MCCMDRVSEVLLLRLERVQVHASRAANSSTESVTHDSVTGQTECGIWSRTARSNEKHATSTAQPLQYTPCGEEKMEWS